MPSWRRLAPLAAPMLIGVLALSVRLAMLERYVPVSPWVAGITLIEAETGRNLIEGRWWSANRVVLERATAAQSQPGIRTMVDLVEVLPVEDNAGNRFIGGSAPSPGYSTWFALSYWLGGDYRYVHSQRMQAVLDVGAALLVFAIGARCWSRTAGLIGGLLYALSPPHAYLGNLTVAAATDSFWFLLAAYGALVSATSVGRGRSPWAGASLVGLAGFAGAAMNSTALVLPMVTAATALVLAITDRRYLRVAGALLVAQVVVLAMLTPWALRSQRLYDQFSFARGSFWQLAFASWGELPNPWGLGFDDKEFRHWTDENCPGCTAGAQQREVRDFLLAEIVPSRPFPKHVLNLLNLRLPRLLEVASTPEGVFEPAKAGWQVPALSALFDLWDSALVAFAWLAAFGLGLTLIRRERRAIVLLGLAPTLFLTIFSLLFYVELRKTVPGYGYLLMLAGIAAATTLGWVWRRLSPLDWRVASAVSMALTVLAATHGTRAQSHEAATGGELHSAIVGDHGQVWTWGNNLYGQLGDGHLTSRYAVTPKGQSGGITNAVSAAAGSNHTLALTRDGRAWSWGDNSMGQLGIGTRQSRTEPAPIASLPPVHAIRGGYAHSLALDADGGVWAWGSNLYGQLGVGSLVESLAPVRVDLPRRIVAIAAGWFFSLAVDDLGQVWAWGRNTRGQLGWATESDVREPASVPGLPGVRFVAAGHQHSVAIAQDGGVWVWGANDFGQLALPRPAGDAPSRAARSATDRAVVPPRAVATGVAFDSLVVAADATFGITADGRVWAWGDNMYGQLGDGTFAHRSEPALIAALPPITHLGAGHAHLVAIARDGSLWTWGFGHYGQLLELPVERRRATPRMMEGARDAQ